MEKQNQTMPAENSANESEAGTKSLEEKTEEAARGVFERFAVKGMLNKKGEAPGTISRISENLSFGSRDERDN